MSEFKEKAKEKLQKELAEATKDGFAEPIIGYLLKRCAEDDGLSEDVCLEHKTWKKCFDYIVAQAKKLKSSGNCVAVRDEVVYEWAEDYYHMDDKAEEERKAKEKAEREKKQKEEQKKRSEEQAKKVSVPKNTAPAVEKKAEPEAPKKNRMEGQMDLFSMLGM